jgi:hypothetical protein
MYTASLVLALGFPAGFLAAATAADACFGLNDDDDDDDDDDSAGFLLGPAAAAATLDCTACNERQQVKMCHNKYRF